MERSGANIHSKTNPIGLATFKKHLTSRHNIFCLFNTGFESDVLTNNIAILKINTEFKIGTTVGPVCMPRGQAVMADVDTTECYATGWGKPVTGK